MLKENRTPVRVPDFFKEVLEFNGFENPLVFLRFVRAYFECLFFARLVIFRNAADCSQSVFRTYVLKFNDPLRFKLAFKNL